eukprot:3440737-Amphidinium_carterae.1
MTRRFPQGLRGKPTSVLLLSEEKTFVLQSKGMPLTRKQSDPCVAARTLCTSRRRKPRSKWTHGAVRLFDVGRDPPVYAGCINIVGTQKSSQWYWEGPLGDRIWKTLPPP